MRGMEYGREVRKKSLCASLRSGFTCWEHPEQTAVRGGTCRSITSIDQTERGIIGTFLEGPTAATTLCDLPIFTTSKRTDSFPAQQSLLEHRLRVPQVLPPFRRLRIFTGQLPEVHVTQIAHELRGEHPDGRF